MAKSKYEYKVVHISSVRLAYEVARAINNEATDGWRLVSITPNFDYVFERDRAEGSVGQATGV